MKTSVLNLFYVMRQTICITFVMLCFALKLIYFVQQRKKYFDLVTTNESNVNHARLTYI